MADRSTERFQTRFVSRSREHSMRATRLRLATNTQVSRHLFSNPTYNLISNISEIIIMNRLFLQFNARQPECGARVHRAFEPIANACAKESSCAPATGKMTLHHVFVSCLSSSRRNPIKITRAVIVFWIQVPLTVFHCK